MSKLFKFFGFMFLCFFGYANADSIQTKECPVIFNVPRQITLVEVEEGPDVLTQYICRIGVMIKPIRKNEYSYPAADDVHALSDDVIEVTDMPIKEQLKKTFFKVQGIDVSLIGQDVSPLGKGVTDLSNSPVSHFFLKNGDLYYAVQKFTVPNERSKKIEHYKISFLVAGNEKYSISMMRTEVAEKPARIVKADTLLKLLKSAQFINNFTSPTLN